jgi:SpoVK/Ycf46/Vps4 family AAA+-type ATPase
MEDQVVVNWNNYLFNIDSKLQNMWNFILYNQFNNEEIRRLERQNKFSQDEIDYCRNQIDELEDKNDSLRRENRKLDKKINLKRKRIDDEIIPYSNEIKKPNNFEEIDTSDLEGYAKNIFKNLNNIKNIIELENHEYKYNLLKNEKFKKLFDIIPSLKELDKIIGMIFIKEEIFKMICYFLHGLNNKEELNHIVITGPPGIGKTTVASIIGKIVLQLGFLKNNRFVVAKRSDLIGKYCGHTAVQTQEKIDEAEGGVLFIDEVYSLGNAEKKDSFTKECIDTINQNLTEKGDKFLCIIAGYEKDVETCFFAYNKGLERRFTIKFNLKPYTAEELCDLFIFFAKEEDWKIDKIDTNIFKENYDLFKFYASDMRLLLQKAKENFSLRLMQDSIKVNKQINIINEDDINYAIDYFKEKRILDINDNKIFTMYT